MRITRVAVTGATLAALTLAGTTTALAEQPSSTPPSGSVTITLSAEQVAFLCEKRLPRVETRAGRLIERINGGPDVKGSTEWLKARAAKEREAGRETSAQLLEERAERRAGRVDQLNKIKGWAAEFRTQHCGAK
ncbi:MAG TPA: hypothetical protein VFV67_03575 [Actinophytocola sp.]|uniref:hypothetical protein n=1 Tax=Actinophytocola sp. TaxID=1872138 RepID=UPI002DBD248A|nr:hypothetical protein [Actinophytocola sp.]HEU5469708.1 hypothetical protein [Actinophytocola sp.]